MAKFIPKSFSPKPRYVTPDRAAGHDISALHDRQQKRQAERQRHEQKVIECGGGEL
jgi:hypothetical protein